MPLIITKTPTTSVMFAKPAALHALIRVIAFLVPQPTLNNIWQPYARRALARLRSTLM